MFILNQDGTMCIDAHTIILEKVYKKQVQQHLNRIRNDTMSNSYNFGSTKKLKMFVKKDKEDILNLCLINMIIIYE